MGFRKQERCRFEVPSIIERFTGQKGVKVAEDAMRRLIDYSWPGNVRELENVIERAVILSKSSSLAVEQLQTHDNAAEIKLQSLADHEREYIEKVMERTYWRIDGPKGAARILEMHPETLRSRMRKLGIERPTVS